VPLTALKVFRFGRIRCVVVDCFG